MTGCLFSIVALFTLVFVMLFLVASGGDSSEETKPHTILDISLNGRFEERKTELTPFDHLLGINKETQGLEQLCSAIKYARNDKNVCGINLVCGATSGLQPAMQEELRTALADFKASGKFIMVYADHYTQEAYYVTSVADCVMLNPLGTVQWKGLAAEVVFYKDLLKKLGVEMEVFKVGDYKSAVEPFVATEMSDANREQITSYVQSIWHHMANNVSASRHIPADSLMRLADSYVMFASGSWVRKYGLVDTVLYYSQVRATPDSWARRLRGKMPHLVRVNDYLKQMERKRPSDRRKPAVAVYYACGDIVDEKPEMGETCIHAATVCKDLLRLSNDSTVKAVVLRINSGGGSAYASEQIWHEVQQLRKHKPVVVSMSGMAASGGYYMACGANCIVAQPTTLTGSIGIFGMFPDAGELLQDKLGLKFDRVKTNDAADMGSWSRSLNDNERNIMEYEVLQGYNLFLQRVSQGRRMPIDSVGMLAQGRVWTGEQALANGLVDTLGGLDVAVGIAAKEAGLEKYALRSLPKPQSWYERMVAGSQQGYLRGRLQDILGDYYQNVMFIKTLKSQCPIQARLPYTPNFIN